MGLARGDAHDVRPHLVQHPLVVVVRCDFAPGVAPRRLELGTRFRAAIVHGDHPDLRRLGQRGAQLWDPGRGVTER